MDYDTYELDDAVKQVKYKNALENIRSYISNGDYDLEKIMDYSINYICEISKSVAGTFWYYDINGDGLIRALASHGSSDLSNIRLKIGEGIAGKVIETGNPETIFDVQSDSYWSSKTDESTGFLTKTMMCVPLTLNKYTFGCIQLINKEDGSFFDIKDFNLAVSLASSIVEVVDEYNFFSELRDFQYASVLYLSIKNFDEISSILDPKTTIKLLNDFLTIVNDKLKTYGAKVDVFSYENILAYWMDGPNNKNFALDACKAGKDLLDLYSVVREQISKKYGAEIYYSIGISYDKVYKHFIGNSDMKVRTIAGKAVSVAKYLQKNADYGLALVNNDIYKKAKDDFDFSRYKTKAKLFSKNNEYDDEIFFIE